MLQLGQPRSCSFDKSLVQLTVLESSCLKEHVKASGLIWTWLAPGTMRPRMRRRPATGRAPVSWRRSLTLRPTPSGRDVPPAVRPAVRLLRAEAARWGPCWRAGAARAAQRGRWTVTGSLVLQGMQVRLVFTKQCRVAALSLGSCQGTLHDSLYESSVRTQRL